MLYGNVKLDLHKYGIRDLEYFDVLVPKKKGLGRPLLLLVGNNESTMKHVGKVSRKSFIYDMLIELDKLNIGIDLYINYHNRKTRSSYSSVRYLRDQINHGLMSSKGLGNHRLSDRLLYELMPCYVKKGCMLKNVEMNMGDIRFDSREENIESSILNMVEYMIHLIKVPAGGLDSECKYVGDEYLCKYFKIAYNKDAYSVGVVKGAVGKICHVLECVLLLLDAYSEVESVNRRVCKISRFLHVLLWSKRNVRIGSRIVKQVEELNMDRYFSNVEGLDRENVMIDYVGLYRHSETHKDGKIPFDSIYDNLIVIYKKYMLSAIYQIYRSLPPNSIESNYRSVFKKYEDEMSSDVGNYTSMHYRLYNGIGVKMEVHSVLFQSRGIEIPTYYDGMVNLSDNMVSYINNIYVLNSIQSRRKTGNQISVVVTDNESVEYVHNYVVKYSKTYTNHLLSLNRHRLPHYNFSRMMLLRYYDSVADGESNYDINKYIFENYFGKEKLEVLYKILSMKNYVINCENMDEYVEYLYSCNMDGRNDMVAFISKLSRLSRYYAPKSLLK